jgi:hypothetical protein
MKDIPWTDKEKKVYMYYSLVRGWTCHKMSEFFYEPKRTPSAIKSMLERHGHSAVMGEPE